MFSELVFTTVYLAVQHTGILRKSVKSVVRFLQHDQPFKASWNTGTPGWCWQDSRTQFSSHELFFLVAFITIHLDSC